MNVKVSKIITFYFATLSMNNAGFTAVSSSTVVSARQAHAHVSKVSDVHS